jgi:hypothetical protein
MRLHKDMRVFMIGLAVVVAAYLLITFLAPPAAAVTRYGLTLAQTQLIRISFALPLIFIWTTALLSVVWFRRYTKLLDGAQEAHAFRQMTIGLFMLLLVISLPSFVSGYANFFPDKEYIQSASIIFRNYLTLFLYLVGFWYLWQASRNLIRTIEVPELNSNSQSVVVVLLATLAVVYSWAVLSNPFRTVSTDPLVRATYYVPDAMIIFTIVIPYVLVWIMGVSAIMNITAYSKRVQGLIYKKIFSSVAHGLTFTVAMLVGLQFLSQANAALGHAAISVIMMIIYVLLFAIATGYFLIARGARKLAFIEEVK